MKILVLLMFLFALCESRYNARGNGIQRHHLTRSLANKSDKQLNDALASNRASWLASLRRWKRTANEEEDDSADSFGRPVKIRIRISRRRGKVPVRDYLHLLDSEDDDGGQDDAGDLLEQPLRMGKKLKPMVKNLQSEKKKKKNKTKNKNRAEQQKVDRFVPDSWIHEAGRTSPARRFQTDKLQQQQQRPVKRNEKKKKQAKNKKQKKAAAGSSRGAESEIGRELSALAEWFLRDDAAFDKILQETMSSYRRSRHLRYKRRPGLLHHRQRISLTFNN